MTIYNTPCTNSPTVPSIIDKLNKRINDVSNKVSNITPYEEKVNAYIGDTEVSFYRTKGGVVSVNCITQNGLQIPTTLEFIEDKIKVNFDPLEELATVTISIQ